MSFAHPSALAWAALAVPIIVFYILKIRLRRVPVSTTLFWEQIFEEKKPRSLWEMLRHLLSLFVQLAVLGLVVLALAEPFFRWEVLEARRLVLVLDNSASMNANDVSPSRLAKAKEEARRIVDGLRFRDEVAVLAAGTEPQVFCGLTGHQRTLRSAIEAVPATDGPSRVSEAVALARNLLVAHKNRRVIVLSDGGFDGAEALATADDVRAVSHSPLVGVSEGEAPAEPPQAAPSRAGSAGASPSRGERNGLADDVTVVPVGQRTGNVGITRFQTRRSLIDPLGYEVLAEVTNASDEPVECRLEIDLNDEVIDVVPLKLAAGGTHQQVFEKTSMAGGRLVARLNRADALPADNRAWAILPRREVRPVTLVTQGNLFLEKVFEANAGVKLRVTKALPTTLPAGMLTVFHRDVPKTLPPGPLFVVQPSQSTELWEIGDTLQNPIVTQQDKDSPLMANVRLDNVLMPEARKLQPRGRAKVLATAVSGDPLYLAFERPEGNVLVLTVNLDRGDLPLQTAFPIMVANALGWFAGPKGELRAASPTGSVAQWDVPPGATASYTLHAPDGRTLPLAVQNGRTPIGPLDRCGVWTIDRGTAQGENTPPEFELACNLANRRESDLRPPKGWTATRDVAHAGFAGRPLWYILIAAAWGLVSLEWYLYQRRWIS